MAAYILMSYGKKCPEVHTLISQAISFLTVISFNVKYYIIYGIRLIVVVYFDVIWEKMSLSLHFDLTRY